ncbi:CD225/dispanin family protein [Dysgonomonas sp. 25]|uniref:CD225/dispanin family protein n=1 Tax=Dysgonomonas sp. 25 TaxID=2302933 RepID=UPI0013D712B4|nr:CD225/dispanin family protein [Dysgonomonas sp. 25]NDV68455.1 CD225/dispanin family protein [Dysgonomonas sp. 25]
MSEELNNQPQQEPQSAAENNEAQNQTAETNNTTPPQQTPPPASPTPTSGYTSMYEKPASSNDLNDAVMPKNNMALGIAGTVISVLACCTFFWWIPGLVLGIVSIVFSTQVKSKFNAGDIDGAESAAKNAKICGFISIALGGLALLYLIIILITSGPVFMEEFNRQMEMQGY